MENHKLPLPTDRSLKRRQTEDDVDNPNRQAVNTGSSKRPRFQGDLDDEESKVMEDEEIEEEERAKTINELIEADKMVIEKQLQSNSSVLILESSPTWKAHCRALFCIPRLLRRRLNIESDFRFNLLDLTGERIGNASYYTQKNYYYHISCMEQVFDLAHLIQPKHLMMKGGETWVGILRNTLRTERFHLAIEDWFNNGGRSYTLDELEGWDTAYEAWKRKSDSQWANHQLHKIRGELECNCESVPEKPKKSDYFPQDPTPRLLSEVLASICKVDQIDYIPQSILDDLAAPSSDEDNDEVDQSNERKDTDDSPKDISEDTSPGLHPK